MRELEITFQKQMFVRQQMSSEIINPQPLMKEQ